jgi:hypothetical protein
MSPFTASHVPSTVALSLGAKQKRHAVRIKDKDVWSCILSYLEGMVTLRNCCTDISVIFGGGNKLRFFFIHTEHCNRWLLLQTVLSCGRGSCYLLYRIYQYVYSIKCVLLHFLAYSAVSFTFQLIFVSEWQGGDYCILRRTYSGITPTFKIFLCATAVGILTSFCSLY